MTVQSKAAGVIFRIRQYRPQRLTPDWYCGCSLGDGTYAMIPAPSTRCTDSLTLRQCTRWPIALRLPFVTDVKWLAS